MTKTVQRAFGYIVAAACGVGIAISPYPMTAANAAPFPAPPQSAQSLSLKVGQGVNFETGQVTQRDAEAGLIFGYIPPGNKGRFWYSVGADRVEYVHGPIIKSYIPILAAAHSGCFKTRPQPGQFTSGDIFGWTAQDVAVAGAYYVVQSRVSESCYLVKVNSASLPTNRPKEWKITLTYTPFAVRPGAPGATNAPSLSGTLRLQNLHSDKLIVDMDAATGKVRKVADGSDLNMNARGDMVYRDTSDSLVITNAQGKEGARLRIPGDSPALSPDGRRLAIVQARSAEHDMGGGYKYAGIPLGHVVVFDIASGKELADFAEKASPEWLPDGRIVMSQYGGNGLYVSDAAVKNLTTLDAGLRQPSQIAASRDGRQIAFTLNGRIWIMGTDGKGLKQAATTGRDQGLPAWSPDGKWLIFTEQVDIIHREMRAVRLSDGAIVTLRTSGGLPLYALSRVFWR